jgi:hypothetical protein
LDLNVDITAWLRQLGLAQYEQAFRYASAEDHGISGRGVVKWGMEIDHDKIVDM